MYNPLQTDELTSRLLPRETILWSGRPKQGLLFTSRDIFLVPFSLVWGGFAIFWEATVLSIPPRAHNLPAHAPPLLLFPVFGAAFVLAGLFFIFGRFILDAYLRSHMTYAVTNHRVLILRTGAANRFTALALDQIGNIGLSESRGGRGTISFGDSQPFLGRQGFGGWTPSLAPTPQLLQIENAKEVFNLIENRPGRQNPALAGIRAAT